ncbi:hypothetical protein D1BOALGB6SA_2300 [Olavius sp. associated proteobacterium Delta 1]|nr:hypothetical protein D1BOALGB6SA_2300 [Olavius sp. associated proteobacterium Delta 1]
MVFARQVLAETVKITRNMTAKDYPGFIPIYGYMVSGDPPQADHLKPNLQIPVIRNE